MFLADALHGSANRPPGSGSAASQTGECAVGSEVLAPGHGTKKDVDVAAGGMLRTESTREQLGDSQGTTREQQDLLAPLEPGGHHAAMRSAGALRCYGCGRKVGRMDWTAGLVIDSVASAVGETALAHRPQNGARGRGKEAVVEGTQARVRIPGACLRLDACDV